MNSSTEHWREGDPFSLSLSHTHTHTHTHLISSILLYRDERRVPLGYLRVKEGYPILAENGDDVILSP